MNIKKNISLIDYNTFNVNAITSNFVEISTEHEFIEISKRIKEYNKYFILGSGSNVLFLNDFDGLIVFINNQGVDVIEEKEDYVILSVSAGENWHKFVEFCINNKYFGLENLALIPGKVGAAPVQNIGAYGIEQCDFIESVEAYQNGEKVIFTKEQMNFGYRNSIFKESDYNDFIIYQVKYKLFKKDFIINDKYKDVKDYFYKMNINYPDSNDLFNAIVEIRKNKLPDPALIGNAGSFFKNPICNNEIISVLKIDYPELPVYKFDENNSKISAAFLIEKAGFKGLKNGDVGTFSKHALILCNFGNAQGKDIYDFSEQIIQKVKDLFGVKLEREVILID